MRAVTVVIVRVAGLAIGREIEESIGASAGMSPLCSRPESMAAMPTLSPLYVVSERPSVLTSTFRVGNPSHSSLWTARSALMTASIDKAST